MNAPQATTYSINFPQLEADLLQFIRDAAALNLQVALSDLLKMLGDLSSASDPAVVQLTQAVQQKVAGINITIPMILALVNDVTTLLVPAIQSKDITKIIEALVKVLSDFIAA